jgi:hypothetical protein
VELSLFPAFQNVVKKQTIPLAISKAEMVGLTVSSPVNQRPDVG